MAIAGWSVAAFPWLRPHTRRPQSHEKPVTLNYRHMLLLAAMFMGSLAVMTAVQGYFEHSPVIVIFQFLASALLLYWALA